MKKNYLFLLLVISFFMITCTNENQPSSGKSSSERFFITVGASEDLQQIAFLLKQKNDSTEFVSEFVEKYGYPVWKDGIAFFKENYFIYAVPLKSLSFETEIDAIWFFVMSDIGTNYYVYDRKIANEIIQRIGDKTEQTWMFDYFTQNTLQKNPASGVRIIADSVSADTRAWYPYVYTTCNHLVNYVPEYGIEVDLGYYCWDSYDYYYAEDMPSSSGGSSNSVVPEQPRPGSGSISISKTASSITPNLSKLFNHQNISTGQALKLESLINKMMLDCLGSTLYNALFTYNAKGKNPSTKINIEFTNGYSSYNPDTNTINLDSNLESNHLFHEMWHAYQSSTLSTNEWNNSIINSEIETHYAQYLYLSRLKEYKGSKWEKSWTQHPRLNAIRQLERYVDHKGNLISGTDAKLFDFTLNQIAGIFETNENAYTDNKIFKYNWDIKGIDNFKNLHELAKDC